MRCSLTLNTIKSSPIDLCFWWWPQMSSTPNATHPPMSYEQLGCDQFTLQVSGRDGLMLRWVTRARRWHLWLVRPAIPFIWAARAEKVRSAVRSEYFDRDKAIFIHSSSFIEPGDMQSLATGWFWKTWPSVINVLQCSSWDLGAYQE